MNTRKHSNSTLSIALCFDLASETVPEWLPLIPAGSFTGRDGRAWNNNNPQLVVDTFNKAQRHVPVDINHSTELKAPKGEEAPAVGFVEEMEVRDGAVWGRMHWNSDGVAHLNSERYRYYSPAFHYDKQGGVYKISSVALANKHNLFELPALNHENEPEPENPAMPVPLSIATALALNTEATEADAVAAINQLKTDRDLALNAEQTPSLDKFVPRADYDEQKKIALNAEQELETLKTDQFKAKAQAAVDAAVEAGKVAPASKDFYLATCSSEEGLAQFVTFIESAPVLTDKSNLDEQDPEQTTPALNAEQQQIASLFGNSAEDIAKYGKD